MSLFELVVISISLAMDAFTVSMMYGISMPKGNIKKQSFIAFYFGFFQALMPFLGYHLGCVFSKKIQAYDHYIAFIFLMIVGINMLKDAFSEEETNYNFKLLDLTILAFATSIDAFAIGMTFAFLEVAIYQALLIIGIITFLLCLFALQIGRYLNNKFQNKALIFGVLRPADLIVVGGGDEGVSDDLVIAQGAAGLAQSALHLLNRGVAAPGGLTPHEGGGDVVIAVEPGDLLGQVGDALHVAAPGGDDDVGGAVGEALILGDDANTLQIPILVRGRDISAQQGIDPLRVHPDGAGLRDVVQNVDDAVHDLARAQPLHQLTGTVHGGQGVQGIQPLFKLGGSLGTHTQGKSALADAGAVEVGRLKDHVHGVVGDLAVLAAHDARQAHGPGIVGDDQVVGGELPDLAVQGGELLALFGQADDDLTALHIAVVEGVHGLAILQHNVVGNVHDVVDGAHAHAAQPLPHPLGGGGDLHVAHHAGGVAGAQVGGGGLHIQQLHQVALGPALDLR